jgi:hypothetical protein
VKDLGSLLAGQPVHGSIGIDTFSYCQA